MAPDPMPEPEGPEDDRFVYVVAAEVEALRESGAAFDSEREAPRTAAPDATPSGARD